MARSNRRANNHHLLWPRRNYNGVRKQARNLPCMQIMLDAEVHAILHRLYGQPKQLPMDDAVFLLSRHTQKLCACYSPQGELINILLINAGKEEEDGEEEGESTYG